MKAMQYVAKHFFISYSMQFYELNQQIW